MVSSPITSSHEGYPVWSATYLPFGQEHNPQPTTNHYKFTGKERDPESGLDYFIARYYSSQQGRFLSPDEFTGGPVDAFSSNDPLPPGPLPYADITNPQSLNKYTYTYNNPLRYTDPNGHCPNCGEAYRQFVEFLGQEVVGAGKAVVNVLPATYNLGAAVLESQMAGLGTPIDLGRVPTLSYNNLGEEVGAAVATLGLAALPLTKAKGAPVREGIYEGPDAAAPGRTYVGQSGNIPERLAKQESAGKFPKGTEVKTQDVRGGKTTREIAEQKRISQLGGVRSNPGSQTSNIRNPIGKKRKHLIEEPPKN